MAYQQQYPNLNQPYGANPYGNPSPRGYQNIPNQGQNFNHNNQYNSNNNYFSNYVAPPPNNQNYAATSANQAGFNMYHAAQPRLHQGQFYQNNKDLNNSLEGGARAGFVRKVYTLLTIQLLITMIIGYWAFNSPLFKKIFINAPMIIILSVLLIVMSCVIGCALAAFRKYALPIFIAFTIVFALIIGISICAYKSKVILMAAGITLLLVVALTAYACFTKTDLTGCGPYLMVICLVLFVFGIVLIFWRDPIVHLIYSCISALLFAIYLVFDTQLVLGRGQYSYNLDDAYLAAIQLYIDIVQLFLHLLQIVGFASN